MNRIKGLDSLRFISITFVVIHHLITYIPVLLTPGIDLHRADQISGWLGLYGIHFFFSGSGFLITYMLQRELKKYKKISLGKFYLRRIFRIWPAYYFVIFLSLVVLIRVPFFSIPGNTFVENDHGATLAYFLFIPQFASFFGTMAPYVFPTYTIGIEEQFYVIWGFFYRFFSKYVKHIFIGLLITAVLASIFHDLVARGVLTGKAFSLLGKAAFFYRASKFGCFAIGALLALAYLNNSGWLSLLERKGIQLALYVLFFVLVLFDIRLPYIFDEQMAIMTCLIFLAAKNEKSIINYQIPFLEYLGKISYGIYLFHMYAVLLVCKAYAALFGKLVNSSLAIIGIAIITIALATCFGYLSFISIERVFLRIKEKFRRV